MEKSGYFIFLGWFVVFVNECVSERMCVYLRLKVFRGVEVFFKRIVVGNGVCGKISFYFDLE